MKLHAIFSLSFFYSFIYSRQLWFNLEFRACGDFILTSVKRSNGELWLFSLVNLVVWASCNFLCSVSKRKNQFPEPKIAIVYMQISIKCQLLRSRFTWYYAIPCIPPQSIGHILSSKFFLPNLFIHSQIKPCILASQSHLIIYIAPCNRVNTL